MILTGETRSTGRETLCQLRSVYHRFTSIVVLFTDVEVPSGQVLMPLRQFIAYESYQFCVLQLSLYLYF